MRHLGEEKWGFSGRRVKAGRWVGGLAQFDEQSDEDAAKGESGDEDREEFKPILGSSVGGLAVDPFVPRSIRLGA